MNTTCKAVKIHNFSAKKKKSQPWLIHHKVLSGKNPSQKRAGGMAQGVGPEFCQKKKKITLKIF
jgi:hypothetical protein